MRFEPKRVASSSVMNFAVELGLLDACDDRTLPSWYKVLKTADYVSDAEMKFAEPTSATCASWKGSWKAFKCISP